MSTLWTPDGERPISRGPQSGGGADQPPAGGPGGPDRPGGGVEEDEGPEMTAEDEARLAEIQEQLARTPAELVVANHAFGLFELAALHLSLQPPQLDQARVAIDAFGALVEGMAGRLGDYEPQLNDGLANLRLAYVQLKGTAAGP